MSGIQYTLLCQDFETLALRLLCSGNDAGYFSGFSHATYQTSGDSRKKIMGRLLQSRGFGGMLPQELFYIRYLLRLILRVFLKHITEKHEPS